MNVKNMTSPKGNPVPNQFIITIESPSIYGNFKKRLIFQSYASVIAVVTYWDEKTVVELDERYWDFSKTTRKYRSQFLGESTDATRKKIASGIYTLKNLNL